MNRKEESEQPEAETKGFWETVNDDLTRYARWYLSLIQSEQPVNLLLALMLAPIIIVVVVTIPFVPLIILSAIGDLLHWIVGLI